MNSIQLLHKLKLQIEELNSLGKELIVKNNIPNAIEKDLLKQKCLSLYESILLLETKNDSIVESVKPTSAETFEAKVETIVTETIPVVTQETIFDTPKNEEQIIPKVAVEIEQVVPSIPQPNIVIPEITPHLNIAQPETTIHEKISGTKQTGLKEIINDAKVESLKTAITLNKKIAFVNELFKENTVDYAKSIDKLNSATDLNEALLFFNELKQQYSWNNDHELVLELEQLIQKRFR